MVSSKAKNMKALLCGITEGLMTAANGCVSNAGTLCTIMAGLTRWKVATLFAPAIGLLPALMESDTHASLTYSRRHTMPYNHGNSGLSAGCGCYVTFN